MGNVNELQEREPDLSQESQLSASTDSEAQSSPVSERAETSIFPIGFYFTSSPKEQTKDSGLPTSFDMLLEISPVINDSAEPAVESLRDDSLLLSNSALPTSFASLSEPSPVINDSIESAPESLRDDSFPLSDSALPTSFDILSEPSPVISHDSDVFHTPDISQLDIEEERSSIDIRTSSLVPTMADLENKFIQIIPQELPTSTGLNEDIICSTAVVGPVEHNNMELASRRIRIVNNFPPCPQSAFKDNLEDPPSFANEDCVVDVAFDGLLSEEDELKFAPNTSMVVDFGVPSTSPDANEFEDEAAASSTHEKTIAIAQKLPSVLPPEVPIDLPIKHLPSAPRHTAEKPNWAVAPDDPPMPIVTPTKTPRKGERRRGGRRGKQGWAGKFLPTASNTSIRNESSLSIDAESSLHPDLTDVLPHRKFNFAHRGNPVQTAAEIIVSEDPYPEKCRLGSDCTSGNPEPRANPPHNNTMSKMAESNRRYSVPETYPVIRSPNLFRDHSLQGSEERGRRTSHRPSWRSAQVYSGITEPSPKLMIEGFDKEVSDVLYQSSPRISQGTNDEFMRTPARLSSEMPIASPMENVIQNFSSSFLATNTSPKIFDRLAWPSLEEEMRFHATERPLLLASKEASNPKFPNLSTGPSPKHNTDNLPINDSDGLIAVSKTRHTSFDETTANEQENTPARVNLPSRPFELHPFSQLAGNSGPRVAFQSAIPVPTRTYMSKSTSLELDPSRRPIDLAHLPGQESQNTSQGNRNTPSGRPTLQRSLPPKPSRASGPTNRSNSQSFMSGQEIGPTLYDPGHPQINAFSPSESRPFASHSLPAPNHGARSGTSGPSHNEQESSRLDRDCRADNFQTSSAHRQIPSTNIQFHPTSFVGHFQENNLILNNFDSWNDGYGWGSNPQSSSSRGYLPIHRFAPCQPKDEQSHNDLN